MASVADSESILKPLLGTDEATLDSKGRILLSKKKRDRLGESFAMAIGEVGCICIFPESRWNKRLLEMERYDPMNPGRQDYARLFFGTSDDDMTCDAQGRVVIPSQLREVAGLKEKISIVGCYDHIEIWDPEEYKKYWDDKDNYAADRRTSLVDAYDRMRK